MTTCDRGLIAAVTQGSLGSRAAGPTWRRPSRHAPCTPEREKRKGASDRESSGCLSGPAATSSLEATASPSCKERSFVARLCQSEVTKGHSRPWLITQLLEGAEVLVVPKLLCRIVSAFSHVACPCPASSAAESQAGVSASHGAMA